MGREAAPGELAMSKRLSWATRIERAKKRGHFTAYEVRLSRSWMTCAIGERNGYELPEGAGGSWTLASAIAFAESAEGKLGMSFMYSVQRDAIEDAERIYAEIQALP
jgi:hypothetical protein